jgi:hypothetical protein
VGAAAGALRTGALQAPPAKCICMSDRKLGPGVARRPMAACSIELPDPIQGGRPVAPRGPAAARSSGSGKWGCEIEEPASTRPAEVRAAPPPARRRSIVLSTVRALLLCGVHSWCLASLIAVKLAFCRLMGGTWPADSGGQALYRLSCAGQQLGAPFGPQGDPHRQLLSELQF